MGTPIAPRFWAKVNKNGPVVRPELGQCWDWTGAFAGIHRDRPKIGCRPGSPLMAYRVSWEIHFGPIPAGMNVLHRCDNPPCTNPAHLFLGTQIDNIHDMIAKGRNTRGEASHHARLTADAVRLIRLFYSWGDEIKALALRFGISYVHTWKICTRAKWKQLDADAAI